MQQRRGIPTIGNSLRTAIGMSLVLVAAVEACSLRAQSAAQENSKSATAVTAASGAKAANGAGTARSLPSIPRREHAYYNVMWGVDATRAKAIESGELIEFSYRVLDADKAKTLNDKNNEAFMVDPGANVKLVIPSLEKVGLLRQTSTPQEGKIYWMAFSNPGLVVKKGDRVNVIIGNFHVEGLTVE